MRLTNHVYAHPQRLLLTSLVFLVASWAVATYAVYEQRQATRHNAQRIAENAQTAMALCDAAGGARDFWIKVKASTVLLLGDPGLSPLERKSNEGFKDALTDVIAAADGLAKSCDNKEE